MTGTPAALHTAALNAMIGPMTSCAAAASCHKGSGRAMLVLEGVTDLRTRLVNKPSCEVPTMPLVDPRTGDAALANSWLWLKLVHPLGTDDNLKPVPAWGTPTPGCNQVTPGTFGQRMPQNIGSDYLQDRFLAPIRDWICAGAPGP